MFEIGNYISYATKYDKVEDTIMVLGNNAIVKLVTLLYHYNKRNEKEFYMKEADYTNKHGEKVWKVIRNIDCFLTIENKQPYSNKQFVALRGSDIENFKINELPDIEICLRNTNGLYRKIGNTNSYEQIRLVRKFRINGINNTYIDLEFTLKKYYSDNLIPCVVMYINSDNVYSIIPLQDFYNFTYLLSTIQIQTYAAVTLNSLLIPKK